MASPEEGSEDGSSNERMGDGVMSTTEEGAAESGNGGTGDEVMATTEERSDAGSGNESDGIPPIDLEELDEEFSSAQKNKVALGRQLKYQRHPVSHFSAAVLAAKPEKSANLKKELLKLRPNASRKSGKILYRTASGLRARNEQLNAVLFYQLSADAYEREGSAEGIMDCCVDIYDIAVYVIQKDDELALVKFHIVPIFHQLRIKVKGLTRVRVHQRIIIQAICLSSESALRNLLQEYGVAVKLCQSGIKMMKAQFPFKYKRYNIYGRLLYNLADATANLAHGDVDELNRAANFCSQSLAALRLADDYEPKSDQRICIGEVNRCASWVADRLSEQTMKF